MPVPGRLPPSARRILVIGSFLLVPLLLVAYLYAGVSMALGVVGGGALALLNFWFLALIVVRTTGGEMRGGALFVRMSVKYLLLAASLGVLILVLRLDGLGLMLGVGVIFPAILIGSMMDLFGDADEAVGVTN